MLSPSQLALRAISMAVSAMVAQMMSLAAGGRRIDLRHQAGLAAFVEFVRPINIEELQSRPVRGGRARRLLQLRGRDMPSSVPGG